MQINRFLWYIKQPKSAAVFDQKWSVLYSWQFLFSELKWYKKSQISLLYTHTWMDGWMDVCSVEHHHGVGVEVVICFCGTLLWCFYVGVPQQLLTDKAFIWIILALIVCFIKAIPCFIEQWICKKQCSVFFFFLFSSVCPFFWIHSNFSTIFAYPDLDNALGPLSSNFIMCDSLCLIQILSHY